MKREPLYTFLLNISVKSKWASTLLVAAILYSACDVLPIDPIEQPIHIVFKMHIEPQAGVEQYRKRRNDVEAVREIAESYDVPLTIHGNGEFWQYAAEEGDVPLIQTWVDAGHNIGLHMHSIYEDPDGSHKWHNATAGQQQDESFVRNLWTDHDRYLRMLLPDLEINQATPYNSLEANFVDLMEEFKYVITGGGRHEVSVAWFGHHPFYPWRIGKMYLEEDLDSPVLIVHHQPQIGEADEHGPPDGRVFEDQTLPHLKVQFLQILINRIHAERNGQADDRLWLFGFLTHDNKSGAETVDLIDEWLNWLTANFGKGKKSLRDNQIIKFTTFNDVRNAYLQWETEHPGVSSFHVDTPTPVDPNDPTVISDEASRTAYPDAFWGLAQLLAADEDTVVDYVQPVNDFVSDGVTCHEIESGPRKDSANRTSCWLCWKESDEAVTIDVSGVTGAEQVQLFDPVDMSSSVVDATSVVIADLPVLFEGVSGSTSCSLADITSTSEVTLVGEPLPCNPLMDHLCMIYRAVVEAPTTVSGPTDDPSLDDDVLPTNILLVIQASSEEALCTSRWITFDAGQDGEGYGPSFGGVPPGGYQPAGDGFGDDLIHSYVEAGYVTVDIIWQCRDGVGEPCDNTPWEGWAPQFDAGTAWYHNLNGTGYIGAASRARAVYEWVRTNSGSPICSHAHSSGSGRLVAAMTRFNIADIFDTVVFDGGPVWTYVPWICGLDEGPLGPRPLYFSSDIDGPGKGNIDCMLTSGNNEAECSYSNCTDGIYDESAFIASSNFYRAMYHDFPSLGIGVVIGGSDSSSAWKHVMLWLSGYSYDMETVSSLNASSITLRQGYCTTTAGTFISGFPCMNWSIDRFPGVFGTGTGFDDRLVGVEHSTTSFAGGMEVVREVMLSTCEP